MSKGTVTKFNNVNTPGLGTALIQPTLDLLVAMGHGNGSGATEEFVNHPGGSAYVVENFGNPSDPITTKLNLAIPAAKAAGVRHVILRDLSLPYDASLVNFDNAVRVVREGQRSWSEYDARAYGASITGSDGYAGLQAAADAIGAAGGVLRLEDGDHSYSLPLWLKREGTRLLGSAAYKPAANLVPCVLRPTYAFGPAILVAPDTEHVGGLSAPLVPGPGNSWKPSVSTRYFNLRDSRTMDLHGLTALTVECYYRPDDVVGNSILFSSRGRWFNYEAAGSAVELQVQSGGQVIAHITTSSGGMTSIGSADALVAGTMYHIALCWSGTNLYLFVDGVLKATTAKVGTLVQADAEECPVGPSFDLAPECTFSSDGPHGPVYSLNILNVCKYTTNFAKPTAAFVKTGNTLMLLNWDLNMGPLTRGQTYLGDGWLLERQSSVLNGVEISGLGVADYSNRVTAIMFAPGCANHAEVSYFQAAYTRDGIRTLPGPGIPCHMHDLHISASRYSLCLSGGTAFLELSSININNGMLPLWLGCGAAIVDNFEIICDATTVFAAILMNYNSGSTVYHVRTLITNTENGLSSKWRGSLAIGGFLGTPGAGALLESCALGTDNSVPVMLIDSTDDVVARGCAFVSGGSPPATVMQVKGSLTRPVKLEASRQAGTTGWLPWSDVAGTAVVGKIGPKSVTFSPTPTFSADLGDDFSLSTPVTAPITAITVNHLTPGQELTWFFQQDGVGHAIAAPPNWKGSTWADAGANKWTLVKGKVGLDLNIYPVSVQVGT